MMSGEVLQIGGGNIGRALVGTVMHEAGLHVTFADVNSELIEHMNDAGEYPVRVVSLDGERTEIVDDISAISSMDEAAMIQHIVDADMITTAVGVGILPRVAPTLARGLMARLQQRPADEMHVVVVACENVEKNSETLRDLVFAELPDDEWRERVREMTSFPNAAVDRIVPNVGAANDPLEVVTEDYYQLAIDRRGLLADMPDVPGIQIVDDLEAVLTQKLFTLNGAHAAAAYWGYLKGCETIDEALAQPDIRALVDGLMDEVSAVLVNRFPSITAEAQAGFAAKTVTRFLNPYLKDQPSRVGREPKRKLASNDRLIKPAVWSLEQGELPANLTMALVGGLRFDSPADTQAVELHTEIATHGIDEALVGVTGLHRAHPLVRNAVAAFHLTELTA